MASKIEELRAKLNAQDNKGKFNKDSAQDNISYPFWDIPENTSVTVRFLPDEDSSNDFFWRQRLIIRLPFQGVKGEHTKETTVQVPCMEMFGETCPIIQETKPWWKDESTKDLARVYYKKPSYVFQGFVLDNQIEKDTLSPTTIRRFIINPSIFDIIKSGMMDPDIEEIPTHFVEGRDFVLTRTKKGEYSKYDTSKYRMKTRSLSEAELNSIKQNGLYDLKQFLPAHPGKDGVQAIKEMFEASVNGEAYDSERWGKFFKPFGTGSATKTTASVSAAPTTKSVLDKTEEDTVVSKSNVEETTTDSTGNLDIDEVLKLIGNRTK